MKRTLNWGFFRWPAAFMDNWMTPFLCPYVSVFKINPYIWGKVIKLKIIFLWKQAYSGLCQ